MLLDSQTFWSSCIYTGPAAICICTVITICKKETFFDFLALFLYVATLIVLTIIFPSAIIFIALYAPIFGVVTVRKIKKEEKKSLQKETAPSSITTKETNNQAAYESSKKEKLSKLSAWKLLWFCVGVLEIRSHFHFSNDQRGFAWACLFYSYVKTIKNQYAVDQVYSNFSAPVVTLIDNKPISDSKAKAIQKSYRLIRPILNDSHIDPSTDEGLDELWRIAYSFIYQESAPWELKKVFSTLVKDVIEAAQRDRVSISSPKRNDSTTLLNIHTHGETNLP